MRRRAYKGALNSPHQSQTYQTHRSRGMPCAYRFKQESPTTARKDIVPIMIYLLKLVYLVECNIPKQSHYVRCPALGMLCNSLCGPQMKKLETLA